jgi:serpin B
MTWLRRVLPVVVMMSTSMSCAGSGGTATAEEVRADVPRAQAGVDDAQRAARSVNWLGLDLLRSDLGQDKGNVAMSPWSIATALAMVRAGARGVTAAEMDRVLHLMDVPDVHQAMNGLAQEMAGRNGRFPGDRAVELNAANHVFAQRGLRFEAPFLNELARSYGAGLGLVDYKTGANDARRAINAWVDGQTHQRIPELLSPGTLDTLTRMVLVNAVYLKADWALPFPKEQTAPGPFHAPQGDVQVPFMRGMESRRFAAGDGWKAVELLYAGGKLAMTVLVPDAGRYDDVAGRLSADMLNGILDGSEPIEVDLQLPKSDSTSPPHGRRLPAGPRCRWRWSNG